MRYQDKVYGNFNITEPVILELLNSSVFKRLKNVDQGGYGALCAKPYKKQGQHGHNRLAHSVGVYLLLKKYGAPLKEQIAGLIHDVSHSVFSHCIDYVADTGNGKEQSHQDNLHNSFIKKTQIPKILKKYGFELEYILNDKNFPLKENKLPDLCADRIDYALKEGVFFKEISLGEVKSLLNNLRAEAGHWLFKNIKPAKKFAKLFYKLNNIYFAGEHSAIMFLSVGNYLKYALQKKYIKHSDLYTTDKIVIKKIKKHLNKDKKLNLLWQRMNGKIKVHPVRKIFSNGARQNRRDYDARIFCKSRIVDPLFMDGGKIKRLSQAEPSWGKIVKQELKPKQYFLKFEK